MPDGSPDGAVPLPDGRIAQPRLATKRIVKPRMARKTALLLKSTPGRWYLASPYSLYEAGLDMAWVEACRAKARLLRRNVRVYSPIAETHGVAVHGDLDALDGAFWLEEDRDHMERACGLIVLKLPGWEQSAGVVEEIRWFTAAGKPIVKICPEELA